MPPRHLRAKAGVTLQAMARALAMSPVSVRLLEGTPTLAWQLRVLATYVQACGYRLKLVAVRDSDSREELLS